MEYSANELESALKRAFVDSKADYVVLESRRERFLLASAQYGIDNGWLEGRLSGPDPQSMSYKYRLTKAGIEHFGLA